MELFILFAIIWVIIGCLIGSAKGQFASGLIWSLLLGPFGVLIVLCLPNLKKAQEDAQRALQIQAEAQAQRIRDAEHKRQMEMQLELQREQIRQLQQLQHQMVAPPTPPRPPPQPRPAPAPAARTSPAQFKFSCPHCGQHISVTTDYVGTAGSCPTCNNELTVPSPSA